MAEVLSRVGVEHSADFQNQIIRPLTGAWNEAVRIVHEAGGDPNQLAQVMSLQGKAQFEGLDELFSEMPESAKMEAHEALRTYKRYEEARQRAVANAPRTMEAIREKEVQREYQNVQQQRAQMASMFDALFRACAMMQRWKCFLEPMIPRENGGTIRPSSLSSRDGNCSWKTPTWTKLPWPACWPQPPMPIASFSSNPRRNSVNSRKSSTNGWEENPI